MEDDEFFDEFVLGTMFVRNDRFLQVLIGGSTMGPLSQLAQISTDIDARWPTDDVWDIVPELDDMPVGMVLDSEESFNSIQTDDLSEGSDSRATNLEEGALTFSVELVVRGAYFDADATANTCSGAGLYDDVAAGSVFSVIDRNTEEILYSNLLSPGTLQQSSCVWTIAILGLPPRSEYEFFVDQKRMGTARFDDIQQGETVRFEKDN